MFKTTTFFLHRKKKKECFTLPKTLEETLGRGIGESESPTSFIEKGDVFLISLFFLRND